MLRMHCCYPTYTANILFEHAFIRALYHTTGHRDRSRQELSYQVDTGGMWLTLRAAVEHVGTGFENLWIILFNLLFICRLTKQGRGDGNLFIILWHRLQPPSQG